MKPALPVLPARKARLDTPVLKAPAWQVRLVRRVVLAPPACKA